MAILLGFNGDQRWQPICFFGRGDGELQPRHCIRIPSIRKCGDGLFAAYMLCGIYVYIYICKYMYANGSEEIEGPWNFKGWEI
jgi:hypothetical protein